MKQSISLITSKAFLSLFAIILLFASEANAQNRTTVLVLAETYDKDSLSRENSVNRRIRDAIEEQMNAQGFDTYDEMAVTYGTTDTSPRRYSRAELIDIAKNNATYPGTNRRLSIRAAATYQTYVHIEDKGYTKAIRVRVTGRMVDVQSGRFLGTYELVNPGGEMRMKPSCKSRDCVIETVGDYARPIGQAVGNELAELLEADKGGNTTASGHMNSSGPETYSLRFENVTDGNMMDMEEYLVEVFSGYQAHTPVQSMGTTHVYDYVSTISTAKLKRNLHRAQEELGWNAKIYMDGNVFTIKRSTRRGSNATEPNEKVDW